MVGRAERGRQQRSAASSTSAKTVSLLFVRNGRSSTLHPHVSSHHRHRLLPQLRWSQSSIPTHAVRAHIDLVAPSCIHQAVCSPCSSTCPATAYCSLIVNISSTFAMIVASSKFWMNCECGWRIQIHSRRDLEPTLISYKLSIVRIMES